jgi:hypothetical protein
MARQDFDKNTSDKSLKNIIIKKDNRIWVTQKNKPPWG